MTNGEITAAIVDFLNDSVGIESSADTDLIDAGVDSLRVEELTLFMQLTWGVDIQAFSIYDARTPTAVTAWILAQRA